MTSVDAARRSASSRLLIFRSSGPDALQRRQRAHQHVIHALELARLLDRRRRSAAPRRRRSARIAVVAAAERARVGVGDVVADRAVGDALLDVAQRVGEPIRLLARRLEDVEREPLRALRADAGQALQFLDELRIEADQGGTMRT